MREGRLDARPASLVWPGTAARSLAARASCWPGGGGVPTRRDLLPFLIDYSQYNETSTPVQQ